MKLHDLGLAGRGIKAKSRRSLTRLHSIKLQRGSRRRSPLQPTGGGQGIKAKANNWCRGRSGPFEMVAFFDHLI